MTIMQKIRAMISSVTGGEDDKATDVLHRVENLEEHHVDIQHDLYVVKQRTDILYRLVASMRGLDNVR